MRYRWNGEIYDDVDEVLDAVISDDYHGGDEDYFEEWVNDGYDGVTICGYDISAFEIITHCNDYLYSDILSAYQEYMNDDDRDNAEYELNHSHVGDIVYCQGENIYVIDDDEEDEDEDTKEQRVCASVDEVRQFIDEQRSLAEQAAAKSKKEEDDVLSLFQVVP